MTLNEAIQHAEAKYQEQIESAEAVRRCHGEHVSGYLKHSQCAEEYRQLADWLKELRKYRNEAP